MKCENSRMMIVELEADIYADIEEYCAQSNLSEREFVNELFRSLLKDNLKMLDTMRKGYTEMASINLEICTEFDGCETEVTSLI